MSPILRSSSVLTPSFPRVSGDEPVDSSLTLTGSVFSPRERG